MYIIYIDNFSISNLQETFDFAIKKFFLFIRENYQCIYIYYIFHISEVFSFKSFLLLIQKMCIRCYFHVKMIILIFSQNLLKLRLQIVAHAVYFRGRIEVLRESVSGKRCSHRSISTASTKRACIFILQDIPPMPHYLNN